MTASLVAGESSRHLCGVARDDRERARMAASWVREGLGLGERVVWVEPRDGAVLGWLDREGVDWRGPLRTGALQIAEPSDVVRLESAGDVPARIDGAASLTRQALADGHSGLRVGVETAVALTVMPDMPTQFAFEAAWERLTRVERLSLLCVYDPAVYGTRLSEGIALHPREFTDGLAQLAASESTVRIRGELDLSNGEMVRAFLAVADVGGTGRVTLDLRDCDFVDVAGAGELVAFARAQRPPRVRLVDPPHSLLRILELTGELDEFDLVERPA